MRRTWLVLFSLLFLMGLPIIFTNVGWIPMTELLRLGIQSLPLLFLFAGTYFDNRFEFFDLFVKRGMAFLITLVFLTAYFAAVPPRLARLPLAWASPWVHALTLLPVALALPAIYHATSRWLDNVWLGRQFSGAEAVKHFLAGIQSAAGEESLVREAEIRLREIFHAEARILLGDGATSGGTQGPRAARGPRPIWRSRSGGAPVASGSSASAGGRRRSPTSARTSRCSSRSRRCSPRCWRTCGCSAGGWSRSSASRPCHCTPAAPS